MADRGLRTVVAGFLPLVDAALLIAAREKGFAEAEGIALQLVRETSWANIRDRMAVGHFHCAHMLAPMPIAARLGLSPMPLDIIAPMALGLGGNAVTVSNALHEQMKAAGGLSGIDARVAGAALAQAIAGRSGPRPVFAVVHPHSAHNYDLRYWLHASGVDPDRDVEIVILPPPFLPDALASGRIDGFCVGEPWNTIAARDGRGVIITSKSAIWRSSPEKVLGVEAAFAAREPALLEALIRAIYHAAEWCAKPDNLDELAEMLARPDYIDLPPEALLPALSGRIALGNGQIVVDPDFFIPFARAATFPWKSHAAWFFSQMVRSGQTVWRPEDARSAMEVYRPDLCRRALSGLKVPLPSASSKVEGALSETRQVSTVDGELWLGPDGFFDRQIFDPDKLEDYVARQLKGETL
ncbi:MAG: CmpA/NrtA family ABC transporter substrate-binding protein [Rhodomicrobiaceae bacterium]